MGTNSSKNEDNQANGKDKDSKDKDMDMEFLKDKKLRSFGTINSSIINGDNLSAYSGLKSETESIGESIDKANTASTMKPELNNMTINGIGANGNGTGGKVATLFEWNDEGKIVYVTGTFCQWTQFFIMSQKPNGTFQLVLELPRGVYQYKFKVDNQWRYSTTAPTISDNENNVNNIMDTTIMQSPPMSSEKMIQANVNVNGSDAKPKSKDVYGFYYPGKLELNTDAPGVPLKFYSNLFKLDLNSRQWFIGKKAFLLKVEINLLSENNSCKALTRCPHISLSHLFHQYRNAKVYKFVVVCSTGRVRHKLVSVVYYKPRNMMI